MISESLNWHHLVADFILLARKLEKLGFIYSRHKVINTGENVSL